METGPLPGSGTYNRAVFALRDLPYDRELMRVPAYTFYVGEEPLQEQGREIIKTLLRRFVEDKRHATYIQRRVMTLMPGSKPFFFSEEDVRSVVAEVEGGMELLSSGIITTHDIYRLATQVWFNRQELEYRGRHGIAMFPEVALFNHSCEPNVVVEYKMDANMDYVCVARVLKPVKKGEQLLINYFPSHNLPISRFASKMRERWGFECMCPVCRSRALSAVGVIFIFGVFPIVIPTVNYAINRKQAAARRAGMW
jgi:hypothetical protein